MKTAAELHWGFDRSGFLCEGITNSVTDLRSENRRWFDLVSDMNVALLDLAAVVTDKAQHNSLHPNSVAIRLLMRSCGNLQGVILLAERGMTAESRTLTRSLIEIAICVGALVNGSDLFVAMLKEDCEFHRRMQATFIRSQEQWKKDGDEAKLAAIIDESDNGKPLNFKELAKIANMNSMYLSYRRLSDDSVHVSAKSIDRHVFRNEEKSGYIFRWGAGTSESTAATIHHAIVAALGIGIGIGEMFDFANNEAFVKLAHRFYAMPPVEVI